jgi:hypothetical protein
MINSKISNCKQDLTNIVEKYTLNVLLASLHSLFMDLKTDRISKQRRALIVLEQNKWHLWQYLNEEDKPRNNIDIVL